MSKIFTDPRSILDLTKEVQVFPKAASEPCLTCGETLWSMYEAIRKGKIVIAWKATCLECGGRAEVLNS